MEAMNTALNAVVPFLIYLLFGLIVRTAGIMDEPFLKKLNQAVFASLFPLTIFMNTHQLNVDLSSCSRVIGMSALFLVLILVLSILGAQIFMKDNARRGVVVQAMYRSNTLLFALGVAESVFGAEGANIAAICIAIFVPFYNVAAILILETYRGGKTDLKSLLTKVLKNPLFIGAVVGVLFSFSGLTLPGVLETSLSKLSGMATPLALMILGGTMHLSSIKKNIKVITAVVLLKMIAYPALIIFCCTMLGLNQLELFIVFILAATPVAVASYPMAQNMGGDGDLAGELVVMTTLSSVITLFGWITFLRTTGLI